MKKKYYKTYELLPEFVDESQIEKHKEIKNYIPFLDKMKNFENDDIIIMALIFLLLTEEDPDYITIIALGFLFFAN